MFNQKGKGQGKPTSCGEPKKNKQTNKQKQRQQQQQKQAKYHCAPWTSKNSKKKANKVTNVSSKTAKE